VGRAGKTAANSPLRDSGSYSDEYIPQGLKPNFLFWPTAGTAKAVPFQDGRSSFGLIVAVLRRQGAVVGFPLESKEEGACAGVGQVLRFSFFF
jgi:hypothetical protein